jgi:hypothetical protein
MPELAPVINTSLPFIAVFVIAQHPSPWYEVVPA